MATSGYSPRSGLPRPVTPLPAPKTNTSTSVSTTKLNQNNQQLNDLIRALGSPGFTALPQPQYVQPELNEVNDLRKRQSELKRLAEDPLSDQGLQSTVQAVAGGLARGEQAALGAAKGRAALSGQAGFGGAFAGSAATLSANRASTLGETKAKLAGDLSAKARDQELGLAEAVLNAQLQAESIATQRAQVAQQAQIAQMQAALQGRTASLGALTSLLSNRESLSVSQDDSAIRNALAQQELGLKDKELTETLKRQQELDAVNREKFDLEKKDRLQKETEKKKQEKLDDEVRKLQLLQVEAEKRDAEKRLRERALGSNNLSGNFSEAELEYLKKRGGLSL